MISNLRNVAIIAHVDHGKTTLVDKLLSQTGTISAAAMTERVMDSNDLEKERGITILSKNTALDWNGYRINIVDTPGHADFGGEVERVLSMVDSVLLLVDAVDGPMPQTRFVTQKAFAKNLKPIVVINKVDREGARPEWVIEQVFDLFDSLGATDEQLDFPVVYASAINGVASLTEEEMGTNMDAILQTIVDRVPMPACDPEGSFQMQITSLDYSSYVGAIGVGRIQRGSIKTNTQIKLITAEGKVRSGRVLQVLQQQGLKRFEIPSAGAGDIIAITGIEGIRISDTICAPDLVEALPPLTVDAPTVTMTFQVNDSPFAGQEGKYVTSRQIRDRLDQELIHNVALRVSQGTDADKFEVSGRGELHLAILIETMRREGYELAVSRPQAIVIEEDGIQKEPYERLTLDVQENHQGAIMTELGERKADLVNMVSDGKGRIRLDYDIPTQGLLGFHTSFLSTTSGTGVMTHIFDRYDKLKTKGMMPRKQGALICNMAGKSTGYSLWNLQPRGKLFIGPQQAVYEGMVIGMHMRDNDLVVNVTKEKQLTNVRASGTDENIQLTPPIKMSLEQALEWINPDELVEVTPVMNRIRKRFLKENERKRNQR